MTNRTRPFEDTERDFFVWMKRLANDFPDDFEWRAPSSSHTAPAGEIAAQQALERDAAPPDGQTLTNAARRPA